MYPVFSVKSHDSESGDHSQLDPYKPRMFSGF